MFTPATRKGAEIITRNPGNLTRARSGLAPRFSMRSETHPPIMMPTKPAPMGNMPIRPISIVVSPRAFTR